MRRLSTSPAVAKVTAISMLVLGVATTVIGTRATSNQGSSFLLECRIPESTLSHSHEPNPKNLNEEETSQLLMEGRCFLACASEHYNYDEIGMKSYILSDYWPFLNTSGIDCTVSAKVHECTRGCIRALHAFELLRDCTSACSDSCTRECDSVTSQCHPWIHSGCPITCNKNLRDHSHPCLLGCELENNMINATQSQDPPRDPIAPPSLIPLRGPDNIGQFFVNLSSAAPQKRNSEGVNSSATPAVVFLFKVEEMDSQNISFIWTTSPFSQLDFANYACQDVLVSFAVSSAAGLSNFSLPANIRVHGDERLIPNPPTNIWLSEEMDTRIGFFGHVILNVSWDRPQNDAYLDNFTVSVTPAGGVNLTKCGRELWERTISSESSFVSVEALYPSSLPVMSCQYIIQILAVGPDGQSSPLQEIHTIKTTFDPKYIVFDCQRIWRPPEFWFNLSWTLPSYLRHGNVISNFVVNPQLRDGPDIIIIQKITNTTIPFPQDSPMVFSNILNSSNHETSTSYYTPEVITSRFFFLETYITWNSSSIPYVPLRYSYTCNASAVPPGPSPVENFIVTPYFTNGPEVTLHLKWSPPLILNGELDFYDVCIGSASLAPREEIPADGCSTPIRQQSINITEYFSLQQYPLYIQIRAHSRYVSGNWSKPFIITSSVTHINSTSDYDSHKRRVGIIIGSSLGGLLVATVLLGCICLAVCCILRFRQEKKMFGMTQDTFDPIFNGGPRNLLDKPSAISLAAPLVDDWEIPAKEVIMDDLLGEGAFGEVYKGIVKCPIVNRKIRSSSKSSICTPVAIKLLKLSARGNERQDFLKEIETMKKVAESRNPHVVGLLGCVTIQEPLCLITEFVKYGDLLSYLRTNRRMFTGCSSKPDADAYVELGTVRPADLISFAYQIASGMEHIASLGIVHRDLACRNILVDDGKVLKITDLGMSRETDKIYVQKRTGRVPLKWMAIESIIAREFTSASDVWSYGVTLWEIGTLGGIPYPSIQNEELLQLLKKGYRMERPDNCSIEVYNIMLRCWDEQSLRRPTFTALRSEFDSLLLADNKDEYIDLIRIDHTKLYYQELFPVANEEGCGKSGTSLDTVHFTTCAGRDKSKSPSDFDIPPSHRLLSDNVFDFVNSWQHSNSDQPHGLNREAEGNARDRTNENAGRPVSMYLSRDKKERENDYVDEPSSMFSTSLTSPNPCTWRTHSSMFEMDQFESAEPSLTSGEQNCPVEIQFSRCED